MRILIDCGHGIETRGKRSPDGSFLEYLWNRQVGDLVLDRLRDRGVDAALVVPETNDIALKTRAVRVNNECKRVGVDNVLLLSIHANAAGDGTRWMNAQGWSCYTSKGDTRSDNLAECMYDAFSREFSDRKIRRDMSDGDSDIEENFYILTKTRCPAVLLENFFFDNEDECRWLLSDVTKERIADAIVVGLFIYLSQTDIR